jgi:membrane protein
MRQTWNLLKKTFHAFQSDEALRLAAAVAFYAALSLGPMLIVTCRIVGRIWGSDAVRQQIVQSIHSAMDDATAKTLEGVLQKTDDKEGWSFAAVVGMITLAFSAIGVFVELQKAMNKVWDAAPSRLTVWGFIKKRLLSLSMLMILAALVMVSMLLSWAISTMAAYLPENIPGSALLWRGLNMAATLSIFTVLFASIFKILPDAEIAWRDVWVGAFITTILFTVGKECISILLGHNSIAGLYGAAGSMILLLLWVYYSSVILFAGAEFTHVWSQEKRAARA